MAETMIQNASHSMCTTERPSLRARPMTQRTATKNPTAASTPYQVIVSSPSRRATGNT